WIGWENWMVLARIFQENGGFRSAKHEENIKATRFWNVSKIAFVFALRRNHFRGCAVFLTSLQL
ncbi:MAG: hypothetical protein J6Y67_03970, partial [Lachnospiraceae bacterium]|nr:hypothetical protein [Lachnospiraceae bacterium]